jgi:hypothetical protein
MLGSHAKVGVVTGMDEEFCLYITRILYFFFFTFRTLLNQSHSYTIEDYKPVAACFLRIFIFDCGVDLRS